MENVIWREIEQKGLKFNVSSQGEIILMPREVVYKDGRVFHYPERHVKYYQDHGGYDIFVAGRGKDKNFKVHQIIAFAFPEICGEWFPGAQVNHKNEIKTDNRAENLEWCTASYNINYGTGVERARKKKRNKGSKLMPVREVCQYDFNGNLIKVYPSIRQAVRETGIDHSTISRCCSGDRNAKTAGGYIWEYAKCSQPRVNN